MDRRDQNHRIIRRGETGYRQCAVTVMDTTDPEIRFNDAGECHYVTHFREQLLKVWNPQGTAGALEALFDTIRSEGRRQEYDCMIGLSGGVDSSFLVYLAWQHKLRPLIVHTDTGWNSELAVKNIENIVRRCGFDLYTHVVDWPEMQDLQRAFFRAAVPNQDIPQDHAITAAFNQAALKYRITWVLNGANFATESILPPAWGYHAGDLVHINSIHRRHGTIPLRLFPRMGYLKYALKFRGVHRLRKVQPLNLIRYSKSEAIQTLQKEFGWRYYGGKHYESRFTRFFQGWYLPTKFAYDKRLAHLSSLILNGETTRSQALAELEREHYPAEELREDMVYMQKKLGVTPKEFERLMALPPGSHEEYASSRWLLNALVRLGHSLKV